MPIEIREMVIKAILEDDNDPKSREWLNRVLDEAPMEQFLPGKNKKKARKAPADSKLTARSGKKARNKSPNGNSTGTTTRKRRKTNSWTPGKASFRNASTGSGNCWKST